MARGDSDEGLADGHEPAAAPAVTLSEARTIAARTSKQWWTRTQRQPMTGKEQVKNKSAFGYWSGIYYEEVFEWETKDSGATWARTTSPVEHKCIDCDTRFRAEGPSYPKGRHQTNQHGRTKADTTSGGGDRVPIPKWAEATTVPRKNIRDIQSHFAFGLAAALARVPTISANAITSDPMMEVYHGLDERVMKPCPKTLTHYCCLISETTRGLIKQEVREVIDSYAPTRGVINIGTDAWTSKVQNCAYLTVNLRWITLSGERVTRNLGMRVFPGKHDHATIAAKLTEVLEEYGIYASSGDVATDKLIERFHGELPEEEDGESPPEQVDDTAPCPAAAAAAAAALG